MSDEGEYEIESLLEARVEKGKGRNAKLAWKFRVRWKGYSPDDDTWEPIENLTGSEETLSHFWERINTNGRDYRDLGQFKAGEVFLPIGPPKKRKVKRTETSLVGGPELKGDSVEATSETDPAPSSRPPKRGHDTDVDSGNEHSPKRPRSTLQPFGSIPNILLSSTSTPAKTTPTGVLDPNYEQPRNSTPSQNLPSNSELEAGAGIFLSSPNLGGVDPRAPTGNTVPENITTPPSKNGNPSIPLHRARVANPLVKILNDHHMASLRSHELDQEASSDTPASPPRRKPGPGRSSDGLLFRPATLLTAEKGKLKSVKAKDRLGSRAKRANGMATEDDDEPPQQAAEMTIVQEVPVQPPDPNEILELAGLDPGSESLPDFEDEANMDFLTPAGNPLSLPTTDSLFLSTVPDTENNSVWERSTIFGPLGLGADALSLPGNMGSNNLAIPFQIVLDSSTTIPVVFVDAIPSSAFTSSTLSQRGPPGKFYCGTYASDLLGTLRTKGSFARVNLSTEAANSDQDININFRHFVKRLANNELFVAMVDRDLLAFCSSSNALFAQRLNIPPSLVTAESILVALVSIEDYSAFADATANADGTIWSQYILSAGND